MSGDTPECEVKKHTAIPEGEYEALQARVKELESNLDRYRNLVDLADEIASECDKNFRRLPGPRDHPIFGFLCDVEIRLRRATSFLSGNKKPAPKQTQETER